MKYLKDEIIKDYFILGDGRDVGMNIDTMKVAGEKES